MAFGPFRLDCDSGTLSREGAFVPIGRRGARLLQALLDQAGEVLTKAELLEAGWPGRVVEESNLSVQIAQLRKALGPPPEGGEWIATVPRVGYRFASSNSGRSATTSLPRNEKPSIAVLPFAHLRSDPEQALFAGGLADDIINTLSKLSGLTVIAHDSSLFYKDSNAESPEIARELGVRYLLQGSLQKFQDRIRISLRLNDTERGATVWAERYDRALSDLFALQDEIALRLATEMQVIFLQGEEARLHYNTTTNVEAWTWYVKGLASIFWRDRPTKPGEDAAIAYAHWRRALEHDPESAPLHADAGLVQVLNARLGWWGDRESSLTIGKEHIGKALSLDPDNAKALVASAMINVMEGRFDEAVAEARTALKRSPGTPKIASFAGYVLTSAGLAEEAVEQMERAIRLNPHFPPLYLGYLGNAYRLAGRTEEAIATLEAFSARMPGGYGGRDLVIACERAGRHREAKDAADRLLEAVPSFTISGWAATQFRCDSAELEADIAALRAAGLPE